MGAQCENMQGICEEDALSDIDNDPDTIIRVCSYHRRDWDLVVVRTRPQHMQMVEPSLQSAFDNEPAASLGTLRRLPTEVLLMILHELDVRSFFYFRQVNRQARMLSSESWEYDLVSKHGLEGLRGLLRAGVAYRFTIPDLYRSLTTSRCSSCAEFAGHLSLFTAERCCLPCLESKTSYRVIALTSFTKIAHISSKRLKRLSVPMIRTVPGIYDIMHDPRKTLRKPPQHLVLEEKATQMLFAEGIIDVDVIQELENRTEQANQRYMAVTAYPFYSVATTNLEHGVSCKGCQVRVELVRDGHRDRDRIYSTQSFLSHFSQCAEAQKLWTESAKGTRPFNEPELTRRGGFMSNLGSGGQPS